MYNVVLWDVDGTLLDFIAAEKAAIGACFHKFNMGECTDEMHKRYSQINIKYWKKLERGEISKHEVLTGRFIEFFTQEGLNTSVVEAFNEEYQVRLGDTIVFRDNSIEIVRALKGKAKQYVVSNGTLTAQTRKLRNSHLDELMDGVFISDQIGYEKPDKLFFDVVFKNLGAESKDDVLIVGDSLTSDIQGGNNAGIKTCWYNPNNEQNTTGIHTDYEIHNLQNVLNIVLDWQ